MTYIKQIKIGLPERTVNVNALGVVDGAGRTAGQILVNDSATGIFKPSTLLGGRGIFTPYDGAANAITINVDSGVIESIAGALVDSSYIQTRQAGLDSAATTISLRTILTDSGDVTSDTVFEEFTFTGSNGITITGDNVSKTITFTAATDSATTGALIDSSLQNLNVSIIPITDSAYDLGDSTRGFRSLYVSGQSIYLGNLKIAEDGNGKIEFTNASTGDAVSVSALNVSDGDTAIDSALVVNLIDSAHVQARQITYNTSDFPDSAFVTGLNVSTFHNDAGYLDSTSVFTVVDSAHILSVANQTYIRNNQIQYNTSDFADSAFVTSRPVSTFTNDANYLDSTTVTGVIDATYVQANQTTYTNVSSFVNDANYLDSTTVTGVIDASYVQANQTTYTNVSSFVNDANYLDSNTVEGVVDAAYVQARASAVDFLDSAEAIALIDSAYVQARQIKYNTSDFTDSAFVTGLPVSTFDNDRKYLDSSSGQTLFDSDYIQLRARAGMVAGTGVTYDSTGGVIAIGQDVGTTDDVTFGKITGDSAVVGEVAFRTNFHDSHIPFEEGALWYDPHHKNLNYYTDFDHPIEIGMQVVERVYNNNGYTILKGQPLYYSGNRTDEAGQESPTVALANATSSTKYNVQGLAAEDIPQNSYGQIVVAGVIDDFDTSSLNAGENFFAGLTDGALQNAAPSYPNFPMCLGWVILSDSNDGKVIINQQNHSVNSFRVQGDTHISSNLIIDGNLTVSGTQTITSTENVNIGGNIQYLNAGNTIGETGTTFVGTGLDDAFYSGHYSGDSSTKSFFVKIDATGTPDTFEWGFDSSVGTEATGIAITGAAQLLDSDYGISIDFGATTGHSVGDKWTGTAAATDIDTGFFTNRNTGDAGDGYTHLGLYYDVTENEWTFVSEYQPEPDAPINRADASFAYGDVRGKDFYGTTFTGALAGNATTASTLQTSRNIGMNGDITSDSVGFNGGSNITLTTTINDGAITNAKIASNAAIADTKLATISTASKVSNSATTATSANTNSAIVARDGSGNFSAGTITASITGTVSDISNHSTDDLSEGSTNLYYDSATTQTNARNAIRVTDAGGLGAATYSAATGTITYTGPSTADIRGTVSHNDAGGDGSFSYNNSTGVFTYTGPSATETRAHFQALNASGDGSLAYDSATGNFTYTGPSAAEVRAHAVAGTGVNYDSASGVISIGQPVATTDSVTFNNVYASGTMTVQGTLTGDLTGNVTGDVTGNADTATALETSRNIGGVAFNGTADINLPGVNTAGNQNTSGNAATATALATSRNFGMNGAVTSDSIGFDGTGNVTMSTSIAAGVITSTQLASASTLLIKDAAGSTLKTIIGAGV